MTHARQQIREAFMAKIENAAIANATVMKARTKGVDPQDGVSVLVFAPTEQSEISSSGQPKPIDRLLKISLEIYVKGGEDIEDKLDDVAELIEPLFGGDPKLGGLVKGVELISTNIDVGGGSEQRAANMQMVYEVRYRTMNNQPSTIIQ